MLNRIQRVLSGQHAKSKELGKESNGKEPSPLEDFDPQRHSDQVSEIIEDVQTDRAIKENEIHPDGDGVTQIIDQHNEEKQREEELKDFETPTYQEFIENNIVTNTKFRREVHPENAPELAGKLTEHVEALDESIRFNLDKIRGVYEERLGELRSYEDGTSLPEYVDEFSGGAHTLAGAEVGLALGMAVAEAEEKSSVNASVDYSQLAEEISDAYYMGQNIKLGHEVQSEAYDRTEKKLQGEKDMIEGVPESLSEYTESTQSM